MTNPNCCQIHKSRLAHVERDLGRVARRASRSRRPPQRLLDEIDRLKQAREICREALAYHEQEHRDD